MSVHWSRRAGSKRSETQGRREPTDPAPIEIIRRHGLRRFAPILDDVRAPEPTRAFSPKAVADAFRQARKSGG